MLQPPSPATQQALSILRKGDHFSWHLVTLLALVVYLYFNEISKKNFKGVSVGLALYACTWFVDIANGLFGHFVGNPLWAIPKGTDFLILIGVGAELNLMFAVAGLIFSKIFPLEPHFRFRTKKINHRILMAMAWAAFFAIFELSVAKYTGTFVYTQWWWGLFPVLFPAYTLFFLFPNLIYDWKAKSRLIFIAVVGGIDLLAMIVFAGILKWI